MRTARKRREDGAALVEFALIAPLLILLVLGIVEFGWLFGQYNDVRHGAREGARLAAVDGGTSAEIRDRICSAMDGLDAGMDSIQIALGQVDDDTDGTIEIGETGTVSVVAGVSSLSGAPIISSFVPSELSSTIEFRLEQAPSWTPTPVNTPLEC